MSKVREWRDPPQMDTGAPMPGVYADGENLLLAYIVQSGPAAEFARNNVSNAIQVVANIGVIFGLVFLAVEVGQNQSALEEANVLSRVSVEASAFQRFSDLRHQLIADGSLAGEIWQSQADQMRNAAYAGFVEAVDDAQDEK